MEMESALMVTQSTGKGLHSLGFANLPLWCCLSMHSWRFLHSLSPQNLVSLAVGIVECSMADVLSVYLLLVPVILWSPWECIVSLVLTILRALKDYPID